MTAASTPTDAIIIPTGTFAALKPGQKGQHRRCVDNHVQGAEEYLAHIEQHQNRDKRQHHDRIGRQRTRNGEKSDQISDACIAANLKKNQPSRQSL